MEAARSAIPAASPHCARSARPGSGLAYMAAADAPLSYLAINAAALAIGLLAVGVLTEAGRLWRIGGGAVVVALACLILLTSLFGVSADGATRWVSAGGILLQPGLFLRPDPRPAASPARAIRRRCSPS